jgi:hypothetical protein
MPSKCSHNEVQWHAADGTKHFGKHPPARGTKRFFRTEEEASHQANDRQSFVTSALSAYPDLLNKFIAAKLVLAMRKAEHVSSPDVPLADPAVEQHRWDQRLGKEKVNFSVHLKGTPTTDAKAQEEHMAVGGLRDTAKSVHRLHHERTVGKAIGFDIRRALLTNLVDMHKAGTKQDAWCNVIADNIGRSDVTGAPAEAVAMTRRIIAEQCGHNLDGPQRKPNDMDCQTSIDANLVEAWQRTAKDPDWAVSEWLLNGAPAGLSKTPESCNIFPPVPGDALNSID